jgi:hypothetical protein
MNAFPEKIAFKNNQHSNFEVNVLATLSTQLRNEK